MGSVFYVVLNMSVTAAAVGLVVLLLRFMLRGRLNATARYALWSLVLLRLLLPFSLPSEMSFFNAVGAYVTRIISVPAGDSGSTMTNVIVAANSYNPIHFRTNLLSGAFYWAGVVWLAGASIAMASAVALYAMTAWKLRTAVRVDMDGLLEECAWVTGLKRSVALVSSCAVSSPIVFGLIRSRVVIPPEMARDRETLRLALLHECVHIRRGDTLWRAVSALALCAHWFNPLAWLCFTLSGRDMELACDAGVLHKLDAKERKGYALALAGLAESRQPLVAAAFGAGAVKQRIIAIVKYKRLTVVEIVLSVLLLLALAIILISNPTV